MKKVFLKLSLFIIPVMIYVGTALYIDAYNVFHVNDIRFTHVTPNQNFIKTKYILEHKDKFNAFVFGSSRAGNLPSMGLPECADDGTELRWYNMTYAMGGIEENYLTLKTFTDSGVDVDEVIVFIDEIAMWKSADDSLDNLIFTTYQTYEKSPLKFYYAYIKQAPLFKLIPELYAIHVSETMGDEEYIRRKELFYSDGVDTNNTDLTVGEDKPMPSAEHSLEYTEDTDTVQYLEKLKDLCDEKGIKLIVIASPILESTYREGVEHGYLDFLHDAAQVTDFYCFSGLNEYTTQAKYYFDASHFRPYVGYEMEKVLFDLEDNHNDADFGRLVTKDNVDQIIEEMKKQLE